MSTSARPPPKSTLAATRANAAPWGLVRGGPASKRAANVPSAVASQASQPSQASQAGRTAGRSAVVDAASPIAGRGVAEQRFVAALIATVVGLTLALGTMGARASFASTDSKQRIGGTLGRASLQQMEFRARKNRIAFWNELAASGVRLPKGLMVIASNASTSHWYLQVRDANTGVVCARVGQLNDPPVPAGPPSCEREKR